MNINSFDGKLSISALKLPVIICLLFMLLAVNFSTYADETRESDLAIIQVINEGPHETVLIVNLTREKIDLCGYLLKAENTGLTFDFANQADCKATLAPLSVIRVHSGTGSSEYYASWNDIPWSQKEVWNDESDKATLVDPDGNVVSSYSYGSDYE